MQHDGCGRVAHAERDESRILSWSDDSTLRLWDARDRQADRPRDAA